MKGNSFHPYFILTFIFYFSNIWTTLVSNFFGFSTHSHLSLEILSFYLYNIFGMYPCSTPPTSLHWPRTHYFWPTLLQQSLTSLPASNLRILKFNPRCWQSSFSKALGGLPGKILIWAQSFKFFFFSAKFPWKMLLKQFELLYNFQSATLAIF